MHRGLYRKSGFTIVELLIVIVVIGILAAITIVAYNGIQGRAKAAVAQSDAANGAKSLELAKINSAANGTGEYYPATLAAANLKPSNGAAFTSYVVNNVSAPTYYCLTSTSGTVSSSTTSKNKDTSPGTCVMNLIVNPKMATTSNNWDNATSSAGATVADQRIATGGPSAGLPSFFRRVNSTAYTMSPTSVASSPGGVNSMPALPNTTYTISGYFRSSCALPAGGTRFDFSEYTSAGALISTAGGTNTVYSTANTWVQRSRTFTTTATTNFIQAQIIFSGQTGCATGTSFDFTGVVLTQGSTVYTGYGDGDNDDWVWTGAANASSSVGPIQ